MKVELSEEEIRGILRDIESTIRGYRTDDGNPDKITFDRINFDTEDYIGQNIEVIGSLYKKLKQALP